MQHNLFEIISEKQSVNYSLFLQSLNNKTPFICHSSIAKDSGSSDWLRSVSYATALSDPDFINGLRFRLGQSTSILPSDPDHHDNVCRAHPSCHREFHPDHEFVCITASGGEHQRHNEIRDILYSMVKSTTLVPVKEMRFNNPLGPALDSKEEKEKNRSDVAFSLHGKDHHCDVSIISSRSETPLYIENALSAQLPQLIEGKTKAFRIP